MEILVSLIQEVIRIGAQPWVMPVLTVAGIWTFAAVAVRLALAVLPDRHTMVQYHGRMAILFSLPLMFAVASVAHFLLQPIAVSGAASVQWLNTIVVTAYGPAPFDAGSGDSVSLFSMISTLPFLSGILIVLAFAMALFGAIRMGFQLWSLRLIMQNPGQKADVSGDKMVSNGEKSVLPGNDTRTENDAQSETIRLLIQKISRILGIEKHVEVRQHPGIAVPMTIGWRRPRIFLPEKTWPEHELELILHHELVHIRRGHFLLRTLEEGVRNLFFIHPLVHLLAREITTWREMACDSELLATSGTANRKYAELLYRTVPAPGFASPVALSASISANPDIKKRIKTMAHYPRESNIWNRRRSTSLTLAAIIMTPVLMLASCDFGTTPDTEQQEEFRVIESMPEPVGGMAAIFENLTYPETARRAGIEGRVIVQFTVDEQGNVVNPEVVRGIGGGCDEAAIDAIKAVEWTPGTQYGEPVSTEFNLPVTFRLDAGDDESSDGDQEGTEAGAARLDLHIPSSDLTYIEFNGNPVSLENLSERIRAATGEAASSSNGTENELVVQLSVDRSASMGMVSDVQNVLRENRVHRINYQSL